jgi:outer membrane protein
MKKLLTFALLALTAMAVPVLAQPQPPVLAQPSQPQPKSGPMPAPKVVVLDRVAILQYSKVGRDVARQLQSLGVQNKNNFDAQQKSLAAEGQQLRQQVAILAADARQKKEDAFNAKVRDIQASAERRQTQIQQAAAQSQTAIATALSPIISEIVKERGANLVVDHSAVIFSSTDAFDITKDAIARLDAKLPSYKVTLGGGAPAAAKP